MFTLRKNAKKLIRTTEQFVRVRADSLGSFPEAVQARYINLDRDNERDRLFRGQFPLIPKQVTIKRVPGVDGSKADPEDLRHELKNGLIDYYQDARYPEMLKRAPGVKGCYLSHLRAVMSMTASGGLGLVLEDDVYIDNWTLFLKRLNKIVKRCPQSWDIIMLDCWGPWHSLERVARGIHRKPDYSIDWRELPAGTHSVLVNPDSLKKVRRALEEGPIRDIDNFYRQGANGVNTFFSKTLCVKTTKATSTI